MKRALMCATAAATMVSVGAAAHAQEGWYGTAKLGGVIDGIQDIDGPANTDGALDGRGDLEFD